MKTKNIFLTVALGLFTTFAFSQTISGSAHDFSGAAWNDAASGEICNACHSPHQGKATTAAPIWARGIILNGTGFTAYTSTTFTAEITTTNTAGTGAAYSATPSGVSLLCLTCHDGVSKLDAKGVAAATMTTVNNLAIRNGGSDEHPISIDYNANLVLADGGLKTKALAQSRLSAAGTVECSSCHDVHGSYDKTLGAGLLAVSNAGSAICLTCHAK